MIVWLASYPRSGNTFLRIALHASLRVPTYSVYDDDDPVAQRVGPSLVGYAPRPMPLEEMAAADEAFLVKTHRLRSDDSPALVLVRDGLDAIASYAHLRAAATTDPSAGEAYRAAFEREAEAQITRTDHNTGSWGRNVLSWIEGPHPRRAVIRYEDLTADPATAVEAALRLVPGFAPRSPRAAEVAPPSLDIPTFADLHQCDPGFFRRGASGGADEFPLRLVDRFWSIPDHRRAMDRIGRGRG